MHPVLLVDGSYYVYHRYFATLRWWSFQRPGEDAAASAVGDAAFAEALVKHMENDLAKLQKAYILPAVARRGRGAQKAPAMPLHTNIVFCTDCPRATIWRNEVYGEYKGTRESRPGFHGDAFGLLYGALAARGVPLLGGERLEADDVVMLTRDRVRCEGHPGPFVIVSNDNDYLQLRDDATRIVNLQGKDLAERSKKDAATDRMCKILLGDRSDEIPPICAGVGPKTAEEWAAMDEAARRAAIVAKGGDAALAAYERNLRLICMQETPVQLREAFQERLTVVLE